MTMEIGLLSDGDYRRAVGQRLRVLIDALGISYVQAAADMGISKNHLGNWMRGTAYPLTYALYRFCRLRGVNTDFIFLDDPSGLPGRVLERLLAPPPTPPVPAAQETSETVRPKRKKAVAAE